MRSLVGEVVLLSVGTGMQQVSLVHGHEDEQQSLPKFVLLAEWIVNTVP